MDPNEQLNNFLNTFFENVDLKSPLFYNYPTGIRFDLASDIEDKVLRTRQIEHRFLKVWEAITKSSDLMVSKMTLLNESGKDISEIYLPGEITSPCLGKGNKIYVTVNIPRKNHGYLYCIG